MMNKIKKPTIICLCGSTRFTDLMLIKQWELTKKGYIVLSWCALPDSYFQGEDKTHVGDQEGVKDIVDEVHLRKIDLSDEVLILNVGGYIGESTQKELEYAKKQKKIIHFLEVKEGEKEKYLKIRPYKGSAWCVIEFDKEHLWDGNVSEMLKGDTLEIEVVEMTKEEFEALGEFEGW